MERLKKDDENTGIEYERRVLENQIVVAFENKKTPKSEREYQKRKRPKILIKSETTPNLK